jgi:hypothetical protein
MFVSNCITSAPAQVIQSPPVRESNAYVNVGPHWNQSLDKPEMVHAILSLVLSLDR